MLFMCQKDTNHIKNPSEMATNVLYQKYFSIFTFTSFLSFPYSIFFHTLSHLVFPVRGSVELHILAARPTMYSSGSSPQ